ncbi:hypothetical protein H6F76_07340 [Leptolyngbya sp. FACHB-321]|uniref:hypothetical protein n=1 Tax=Leptolyngbya sp. FACHB-321 TaxID=2692807 RepID=UPI00168429AD|nr:hypothetical protein [Leptolyngbya sp. FACHB-321]MBD2034847.1 hypothetical protein [Leptolyngbya sp. FACHB-321]
MATPSSNPLSHAMSQNNGAVPPSSGRMALDNLIRRELKVSDPNDSQQIAQALLSRYKDTPKAAAIAREAEGVPFALSTSSSATPIAQASMSSQAELQQAIDDVERDLRELTTNAILKDITPELQGWATAIRTAITEGINAAQFAIDSRQRDKAFGIRRTLGDFARVARLIGALTPTVNINYRKLAQSLDEVAAVMLVKMGEAISSIGFNSGRYLLQVAYSDLQSRRDAVIAALRNLTGTVQEAYDPSEWQRGLNAYRLFYKYLETNAQGDLRSLLVETELARVMDSLLQRAGRGGSEGLRQLGATFQIDIEQLRRLVIVGNKAVNPPAPPFTAFLDAVQLFIDSVQPSGGSRLIRIARPPILFYGLYGQSVLNADDPALNLVQLVILRGSLASQLDRLAQTSNEPSTLKGQIILDKVLYDVDRAIDLYAVGTKDSFDQPERRAVAYSYVIDAFLNPPNLNQDPPPNDGFDELRELRLTVGFGLEEQRNERRTLFTTLRDVLREIRNLLFLPINPGFIEGFNTELRGLGELDTTRNNALLQQLIRQELFVQQDVEASWENLVQTMASDYVSYTELFGADGIIRQLLDVALSRSGGQYLNPEPIVPDSDSFSLMTIAAAANRLVPLPPQAPTS